MAGLSLVTINGRIHPLKTMGSLRLGRLWRDVRALDLSSYDLVITDFEPITAWAARRAGKPCLGIAHQYAFRHAVQKARSLAASLLYRWFAPYDVDLGCLWLTFTHTV